jgi:adenylate kinase
LPLIILFGAPGSGKGTQANLVCKELGLLNLSIGNSVRAFVHKHDNPESKESTRAEKLRNKLESGQLQDFEDIKYIVENEIKDNIKLGKNMLIEGLPRTQEQADWLADFFTQSNVECLFFHFVLPESLILERLTHRFYAPNDENPYPSFEEALSHCKENETPIRRKDDQDLSIIKRRLDEQYNGCKDGIIGKISKCSTVKVTDIDASLTPHQVFKQLFQHLMKFIAHPDSSL